MVSEQWQLSSSNETKSPAIENKEARGPGARSGAERAGREQERYVPPGVGGKERQSQNHGKHTNEGENKIKTKKPPAPLAWVQCQSGGDGCSGRLGPTGTCCASAWTDRGKSAACGHLPAQPPPALPCPAAPRCCLAAALPWGQRPGSKAAGVRQPEPASGATHMGRQVGALPLSLQLGTWPCPALAVPGLPGHPPIPPGLPGSG